MLADGNGEYAKALGLELDAQGFGMGTRGQRFAIIVKDGVAKHVDVEAPGQFKVSAAEYVLGAALAEQLLDLGDDLEQVARRGRSRRPRRSAPRRPC